jgi:phosphoglycolate phosphatase-like HAD superfamily hydrolase
MTYMKAISIFFALIILASCFSSCQQNKSSAALRDAEQTAVMDSWAEKPRQEIEIWVKAVTDTASPDFIPEADRIAVFDNDGTLWPEQPVPTQLIFAIDYLKARADENPAWQKEPVMKAVLDEGMGSLRKIDEAGLMKLMVVSHSGITEQKFSEAVKLWVDTTLNPRFGKPYKQVVYQPMVELLEYLRENGFKTFIVSGGGADFLRPWTEEVYGIAPYQVIGSYEEAVYELRDGKPVISKTAGKPFIDDAAAKPVAIHRFIGKIPVFCGGNSDGDQAMMQYTSGSKYKSLCVLLHHTDSIREYAYDVKTLSGHLETALEEAKQKNWLVIDMQKDFKKIFPFK